MATSRAQAPPVNLKERIAALQQRNVSPGPRPTSPSAPSAPMPNSAGLRDKIAKFERKGGVPVPRGSFGLGAPPLAENGPAKRRGELYGNRIPGTVRVSGGGPSVSRSSSPFDSTRSFSTPHLYGEDHDADPTNYASSPTSPPSPGSSFPGLTPQHTGTRDPPVRGTRFSTALELARRAEGNFEASLKPAERESSSSPGTVPEEQVEGNDEQGVVLTQSSSPSPPKSQPEAPAHTEALATEASLLPSPPAIVLSPSIDLEEEQVVSEATLVSESAPEAGTISTEPSNALETGTGSALNSSGSKVATSEVPSPDDPTSSTQEACDSSQVVDTTTEGPAKIAPDAIQHDVPFILSSSSNEVKPVPQQAESVEQRQTEVPIPVSNDQSPLSPMGPFTLANAVHDLGQVVANIHDMFPGQISPLAAPPPFRPFTVETQAQEQSQDLKTPLKSEASVPDLRIPLHPTDAVPIPQSTSLRPEAPSNLALPVAEQAKHLTTPRTATSRPISMIETSPSHVVVAHRVTPLTSRGVPVFLSANANRQQGQQNFEHFPPTPEPNESEFGTVSLHKPSHSFSHARTFVAHGQTADEDSASQAPKFSAVVHAKVTEQPSAPSSSYKDFYAKVPETPQINRTRSSAIPETPMSPGYGELATLLHEAALLELTLEQGELPSEAVRREDSERQQKEQEEKERQKEAAARAKVEEERRKHAAVAKARAKQEATESKSKSSFRNPLLRSKTSHKRDVSMDSVASKDPARSKSTLLPFRPQQSGGPPGSTPVASIPEKEVAPETDDADAASQTSPKSPRQYFAGLRRLTSTSRPSIGSGSQYRNSVSASSEMSSEDSASIPTPPGNGMYSAGSNGSTVESGNTGIWNGSGIAWPSLSPKKSPSLGRAASFADKMWNRGRAKSTISTHSAYDTIERLTKSAAAKSAAALIPPLDPVSFALDVPTLRENDLPSPPEELVSPRRSASLYVASTSQFPPVYPAKPTSPVYTTSGMPQPVGLDALLSEKLTSPVYTPHPGQAPQGMQNLDTLFSAKPTSPVYTPHLPAMAMRSQETITDSLLTPHHKAAESLLPSPRAHNSRRSSWVSDLSMDSSTSSIPSPFFDSFPSVPEEMPMPPALSGRQRSFNRPSLPLPTPSFFEPAPLSSTMVGAEFFSAPSPFAKSATLPRISGGEHHR
ncbi:hypothetical protein D9615_009955 [Tricholomella constricta]|uniref:Uncharacterized protein n=1 Tax=Tricholomella constricta TaxID=117010 RepID=A0A8H5GQJ3_9AGAR|nr:hypothetical protein D9615_009955 [Tricholomella constricta]